MTLYCYDYLAIDEPEEYFIRIVTPTSSLTNVHIPME